MSEQRKMPIFMKNRPRPRFKVDVKLDDKPTKEEYAVAKFLKQSLPEKKTTLLGHKVEYFIASKAVDLLVESHWAKENKKGELNFSNRDVAVDFMARLLDHKFFHRAKKIVVQKESKKKKKESEDAAQDSGKEKDSKKSEKKAKSEAAEKDPKDKDSKTEDKESKDTKKDSGEVVEKKKEKKKIKLDMHLEQIFVDLNEPYVWIYDPIPLRTWITGTLMVVAAVLLCLFPLWPQTIRHYIYYLSVAAAFFLVFIIGLAVLRLVVFVLVWVLTFGKHHLWLLPNLTEDVGFFESFWPLYHYEYKGVKTKDSDSKSSDSKEKSHKSKDEDLEKEEEKVEENESHGEEECKKEEQNPDQSQSESDQEKSESEEAHKTDNGFEFLEADEVSESPGEEEDRKTK